MSLPFVSMARSDLHSSQDSMLSVANNARIGDSGPPPQSGNNGHPVNTNVGRWESLRRESQFPSRSSLKLRDSRDSLPSLNTSGTPPLESRKRVSMRPRRTATDPTSYEQPRSSGSHPSTAQYMLDASLDNHDHLPRHIKSVKAKVNIKPLLRKISRDDSQTTSLDLARSSLEYEGLGIYTNFERERQQGDSVRRTAPRLHHRSTSGASQFSTASASSVTKPGSHYVHPMRQAPSAYTPPLGQSYQTSCMGSDDSGDWNHVPPEGEFSALSASDSVPPIQPRPSLQIHDSSFTRLPGMSQTNVTGRPSFGYSRDNNGSALESASPISRTSLDFVFRPKQRASTDPISRAATVQAARRAFEEKEATKARKFERQQMKAEEKQMRRQEKQNWRRTSKSDRLGRTVSDNNVSEKSTDPDVPGHGAAPLPSQSNSGSWKSQSKNTWMLFLTWLRTRVFKLRRRLRRLH